MARTLNKLTDTGVKAIKDAGKYFDGGGLFLLVSKTGAKGWRLKYRIKGIEKLMSLGVYPDVSLADARKARAVNKELIAKDIDPLVKKRKAKEEHEALQATRANTFEVVTRIYFEWIKKQGHMQASTLHKLKLAFEKDAFPAIGSVPFAEVTAEQLEVILIGMDERGATTSAHRFHTQLTNLFDWAKSGKNKYLPKNEQTQISMVSKKFILSKKVTTNYPIITDEKELGELLRDLDNAPCEYPTRMALKVAPHLASRPYNIRHMEWDEIDFENKLWRIPAHMMKRRIRHLVPLTDYVIEVLQEIREQYSGNSKLVFPSFRTGKVLSESTLSSGMSRILNDAGERKYDVIPHSFRGIFSTLAREKGGFDDRFIEASLAHGLSDTVEAAYNRANYVEDRVKLMNWWSDYLLEIKNAS